MVLIRPDKITNDDPFQRQLWLVIAVYGLILLLKLHANKRLFEPGIKVSYLLLATNALVLLYVPVFQGFLSWLNLFLIRCEQAKGWEWMKKSPENQRGIKKTAGAHEKKYSGICQH